MDPAKWVPNGGAHVIKGGHCRGQQCGLSISGPTAYTKVTLHSQTDPNIKPDDKNSPSAPSGASQIESADVATQLPSATSAHKVEQQQVSKVDPALPTNTVVPTLSDATLKPVMPTSIPGELLGLSLSHRRSSPDIQRRPLRVVASLETMASSSVAVLARQSSSRSALTLNRQRRTSLHNSVSVAQASNPDQS